MRLIDMTVSSPDRGLLFDHPVYYHQSLFLNDLTYYFVYMLLCI